MNRLSRPRSEGALRRRWRARQWPRRPDLTARLRVEAAGTGDLIDVVQDAVLRQDLEWLG